MRIIYKTVVLGFCLIHLPVAPISPSDLNHAIQNGTYTVADTFYHIYTTNFWENNETFSGEGSTVEKTLTIRTALPVIIESLGIKTILDAPCGDFNWMKTLNLKVEKYYGIDIVPPLIESNKKLYQNEKYSFECGDLLKSSLPQVDLILCRDCLAHLPIECVKMVINNFKKNGSGFLLVTTYMATELNQTINAGAWYPYNLEIPPFNFPKPLVVVEEFSGESVSRRYRKSLGLWRIEDLPYQ